MMNSTPTWVQALNIKPATYEEWLRLLPKHESLIFTCLLNHQINSEDYFSWAKEYYGLAYLNSNFFEQKPNISFWKKIEPVANWSEKMIPLHEWDGVVFVACVEPHSEVKWSFPVQYVLASAQDLTKYWQALQKKQDSTATPPDLELPPVPTDEPAGLNLEKLEKLNAPQSEDFMEALAKKVNGNKTPADFNAPDNLNWSPDNGDSSVAAPDGMAPEGMVMAPVPAAPEVITPDITVAAEMKNTQDKINTPSVSASSDPYSALIHEMKNYFTGVLILSAQNETVVPVAWDDAYTPKKGEENKSWDLNSPSALRISARTKQPYLGHIVSTPMNKEFFAAFGYNEFPKKVLIQPVLSDDYLTHLIIATVDESRKNHQTLHEGKIISEKMLELGHIKKVA
ncbi:MAG: hypothetical protein KDD38_00840 [Bdellovibrionales bacterium]|nr:hypothetical protein [Bdellovibrionales bacterium]